ncbi:alkylation response protein AidB-like acyl-CoA dehydrogenase [Nocardia transvalensis]|uniref:Alkylation response protein AidB-like acyl-CoA dehydrogenase n=1 Tax=Nocardia transvalensis TaxID=37333 RepID=A0A7W9PG71_9NOCA|nr:acyl-CoA dehydrogenase family protein [Nocardia transvalensis]MBB5915579.1 alkylation response protein AidB-like acyl-CoA dehydrogenase [Nocardia transvalensis]
MPHDPAADQRFFQATTRDFLASTMPVTTVRELGESGTGFERDWWRRAAELGWTAMLVPESLGGGTISGRPMTELALVATELGRACAPGPFVTTNAVLAGLAPHAEGLSDVVAAVASGEKIVTWAVYEPGRGLDVLGLGAPAPYSAAPGPLATRAEPDGKGYRLTGVKDRVEAGDQADLFLVTAAGPEGPIQVLVPADSPGVTVEPAWTLDLVRRTARVSFEDVVVPADGVAHTGPDAHGAIQAQALTAALLTAAETAGATGTALDATLGWLSDRYTFGRPLASYQALKHRMADNKTWLEACRATATAAAAAWDDDPATAAEAVSIAKSYVGAKAPVIAQDCVQLHGGIGVTWEHDLHLYLRRITLGRALYGTPEEHRRHITDLLAAA